MTTIIIILLYGDADIAHYILLLMIVMMRARLFIEFHIHMPQIRARVHTRALMSGKQTCIMRNVTVISRFFFSPEKENEVLPCKAGRHEKERERFSREVVKAL